MKKLIVIGIITMMIAGLSVAANAVAGVALNLQADFDYGSFTPITIGWYPGVSTDAKDTSVDSATTQSIMGDQMELDILNPLIGSARVQTDFRAVPTAATPEVWQFTATVPSVADYVATDVPFGIKAWFGAGNSLPAGFTVKLYSGAWTANAPAANLLGTLATGVTGSFGSPNLSTGQLFNLPTENGSMTFTVVASADAPVTTPEPGSMLAMFSGLVGLVGFGIRRRK